jgi:hypothetical protein
MGCEIACLLCMKLHIYLRKILTSASGALVKELDIVKNVLELVYFTFLRKMSKCI